MMAAEGTYYYGRRAGALGPRLAVVRRPVDGVWNLRHIVYHSPDGFEWGYGGSGPADLALAILADHLGEPEALREALRSLWAPRSKALRLHQAFKRDFVERWRADSWLVRAEEIEDWLRDPAQAGALAELERIDGELRAMAAEGFARRPDGRRTK